MDATTVRDPNRQAATEAVVRPIADLGRLVDDLVDRGVDEVGELDLDDRAVAGHRGADPDADDRGLGQRRVEDPLLAELLRQTLGDLEDAPLRAGDVLAEQDHAPVALHLLDQRRPDRLQVGGRLAHDASAKT